MFTSSDKPVGYAYDPILRKWYGIDLPCVEKSNWFVASSCGLVCFMDNDSRSELYVCNPITRSCKAPNSLITERWLSRLTGITTFPSSNRSKSPKTSSSGSVRLGGHIGDRSNEGSDGVEGRQRERHLRRRALLSDILDGRQAWAKQPARHCDVPRGFLMRSFVPVPCSLTCGQLTNLNEKLIMVGGIGKQDRPGIGIWEEMARMPHKSF